MAIRPSSVGCGEHIAAEKGEPRRRRGEPAPCSIAYVTTIPNGAAPAGTGVGEDGSAAMLPPSTVNPATARAPLSTSQSVAPSGASRASNAPTGTELNGVLPSRLSVPSPAIEYREMLLLAVLTAKRYRPSW